MKVCGLWLTGVLALAVLPPAPAARADGGVATARLKFRPFADYVDMRRYTPNIIGNYQRYSAKPPDGYKAPKGALSAAYFVLAMRNGRYRYNAAFARSTRTAASFDRLYVDRNSDRRFSASETYQARDQRSWILFGPINLPSSVMGRRACINVVLDKGSRSSARYYRVFPGGVCHGELALNGKRVPVSIVDANLNGVYGDIGRSERDADSLSVGFTEYERARRANPPDEFALYAYERMISMRRVLQAPDGALYTVSVKSDGSALTLARYRGPLGHLRVASSRACITLQPASGGVLKVVAPDGVAAIPAGVYGDPRILVCNNASPSAPWHAFLYRAPESPLKVKVAAGKTVDMACAPPYLAHLDARRAGAAIKLSVYLANRSGYRAQLYAARGQTPPPTLEIKQGANVLHAAKFEFG